MLVSRHGRPSPSIPALQLSFWSKSLSMTQFVFFFSLYTNTASHITSLHWNSYTASRPFRMENQWLSQFSQVLSLPSNWSKKRQRAHTTCRWKVSRDTESISFRTEGLFTPMWCRKYKNTVFTMKIIPVALVLVWSKLCWVYIHKVIRSDIL